VADLAHAIRSGRPHRASGALAYHVLDIMHTLYQSAETGSHMEIASRCEQPQALPLGLLAGELD
jgi:hypothetical protein